ncbi:MAG: efflux RND transporter periplasmic adaptor subunit [Anaerolineae bacterium]|nr:efflux RND transporter periplasmic adaptor subunit [Anaerolineae bacterium]
MKKKWWIIIAVVAVVACLGYVGYSFLQGDAAQQAMADSGLETAIVERGTIRVTIDGSGSLAPSDEVSLAFSSGGEVTGVNVEVGDVAEAGDVLVQLDDADAREAAADAELQVAQAEINLALTRAEVELGLKQANLDAAQASYEEAVALANRTGDQLTSSRVGLEQARDALADAQEDYDNAWDPARDWELEIKWKKDALEAEREATEKALERARYDLEVAQANYNLAVAGISQASVQNAWTQVLNARVALETEPLQLKQLEASLSQAKIRLESAQRALEDTKLIAPMDGTVTALNVKVGERAGAGQAAVVLSDLTAFVVEVNLDEVDVAKVSVGQGAVVTLDAFPDQELAGEVTDIAPVASLQSGVVLYPVTIRLSPAEVPARVGMTANVETVIASKADALIVPLRAIQSDGGKSYVWRQSSGGFEKVEVTLGVMTEIEVEVTGGLSEGDVVSVVASPAQGGGQPGWGPGGMFGGGGDD